MGAFVINKKDLNNFEGFPIWKIEAGKMMRKYELYVEKGEILHRSLSTVSILYSMFEQIKDNRCLNIFFTEQRLTMNHTSSCNPGCLCLSNKEIQYR